MIYIRGKGTKEQKVPFGKVARQQMNWRNSRKQQKPS